MFRYSHAPRRFGRRTHGLALSATARLTGLQLFVISYAGGIAFFLAMTL